MIRRTLHGVGVLLVALVVFTSRPTHASLQDVKTVFIIPMENQSWSGIRGNGFCPYINRGLLPAASHAEQYYTPPGLHPSLPNYLWLEAGSNFGITNDGTPTQNHQSTTNHLVTLLRNAGVSWMSYQEDITGTTCPLNVVAQYAPKHNPMVYFDDVTSTNNAGSTYCISNVRPFTQFGGDLRSNTVARYNFVTPNLCDDMHGGTGCSSGNGLILQGDTWLSNTVSSITASQTYSNGGAIFIVWDEGASSSDGPIGMIVLSRLAKGGGYSNTVHYTHSSTLRTIQEIFNVTPFIRDATNAVDLSDLFNPFPGVTNVTPGCGISSGGTAITISGSNFVNGATVTIGGQPASNVSYINSNTLTAQTPAGLAGARPVVVTNPDTQTATLGNGFLYVSSITFGGLSTVTPAPNAATLTWAAASATGPVTYHVYEATSSGAENFGSPIATTANLSAFVSPLDPGSSCTNTYYFVVRAVDGCGNSDSNLVEQSGQPLPAAPVFAGLSNITAAVEGATLSWSVAAASPPIVYNVFQASTSGAENYGTPVLTTNSLAAYLAPLYPGSNSPITYYFVVRAVGGCGNGESNVVELSVQPLLNPNGDQTGKGIPNGWLQQYGLNPFDTSVAAGDADGDGMSTLQEFLAGTDPTNPASAFRVTSVTATGNDILVSWLTGIGRTNALEWTAGAGDGSYNTNAFTDLFIVTNAAGTTTNYLDLGAATNFPARFYRVRLVP